MLLISDRTHMQIRKQRMLRVSIHLPKEYPRPWADRDSNEPGVRQAKR